MLKLSRSDKGLSYRDEYDYLYGNTAKKPAPSTPPISDSYLDAVNRVTGATTPTPPSNVNPKTGDSGSGVQPDLKNYADPTNPNREFNPSGDYVDKDRRTTTTPTPPPTTPPKGDTVIGGVNVTKVDSDFKAANADLKNFITEAEVIIANPDKYDFSTVEGGYEGYVKAYNQAKADLATNQRTLTLFHYEVDKATPSARDNELQSQNYMLSPTQLRQYDEAVYSSPQSILQRLKDEGIVSDTTIFRPVKVGDTSSVSSSTGAAGLVLNVDPSTLSGFDKKALESIGFDLSQYKPETPEPPKTPTAWDNVLAALEQEEQAVGALTGKLAEAGSGIAKAGNKSDNALIIGGSILVSGAMGAGAGAVDALTYLVRPLAFWRSAEGVASIIKDPVGAWENIQLQFYTNPAYSIGYSVGALFGVKGLKVIGSTVYEATAPRIFPKIPVLNEAYYANKFKGAWVDTALPESWDGVSLGGEANSALQVLTKGKTASQLAPFRGTLLNPARVGLSLGDFKPNIQLPTGVITFMRSAQSNSAFSPFRNTLVNPATTGLGWADIGITNPLGGVGARINFLRYAKSNAEFAAFRGTLLNPASTRLNWGDLGYLKFGSPSSIRGAIDFYRQSKPTKIVAPQLGNSYIGGYKFSKIATVIDEPKPDTGLSVLPDSTGSGKLPSGMSPNKGWAMMDSGVVGKVTTKLDRDTTAFMKNTFKEPTPEIRASGGGVVSETVTKTYSRSNRGRLPNPYYPSSGEESVSIEILHTGTKTPSRLIEKLDAGLGLISLSKNPTKTESSLKLDAANILKIGDISKPKLNLITDAPNIQLYQPRTDSITSIEPISILKPKSIQIQETKQITELKSINAPKSRGKTTPPPAARNKPIANKMRPRGKRRKDTLEVRVHAIQSAAQIRKRLIK